MKSYTTYLTIALIATITLHSCKPDNPCNQNETAINETYNLSQDDKSKIPFRADGLDTLVYISDAGDTATLYGLGVQNYYSTSSIDRYASPDCSLFDEWHHETVEHHFRGGSATSINNINFKVSTYDGGRGVVYFGTYAYFKINNINSYNTYLHGISNEAEYADTTSINGLTYYGYTLYGSNNAPILYNYKYGIIKITLNNVIWRQQL